MFALIFRMVGDRGSCTRRGVALSERRCQGPERERRREVDSTYYARRVPLQ